jgi:hypothetical protein
MLRLNVRIMSVCLGLVACAFSGRSLAQACAPGSGPTLNVQPGDDVQSLVTSSGCGATFLFASGVYNNFSVVPLDYDQFTSVTPQGAILSGSTTVSNWVFKNNLNLWVGTVAVTPVNVKDYPGYACYTGSACSLPEDLFFNGQLYTRVTKRSNVKSGTWYMKYNTNQDLGTVYLSDNPTGQNVQISTTRFAIGGGDVTSVVVNGFVIEYYGSPTNHGAVEGLDYYQSTLIPSFNWLIENNEICYNHGAGVELGDQMTVSNNYVHHNGQVGIGGTGNNIAVTGNQIAFNNAAGYSWNNAGGAKFATVQGTSGLSVTYNYSHDNFGPGLFMDIENENADIGFNTLSNNRAAGILYEISYSAAIHDNTITNDGIDPLGTGPWYGGGIVVANSSDVQVYNNTITNCQNGIIGQAHKRGNWYLENVTVYNNNITQTTGTAAGIVSNLAGDASYVSQGNTFGTDSTGTSAPNTYTLGPSANFVWIGNELISYSQWLAAGEN